LLPVDAHDLVYWETCGNPLGKPALVLHGGPGSGCTPAHRRFFDPTRYRVALFDQRNCGRSRPHAGEGSIDLAGNTTRNLVADIERLRDHLGIERWLVWGGSWGSTLALTYAEAHPDRVVELVLWGVTTGRRSEFDWLFRGGLAGVLPEAWERFAGAVADTGDVVDSYSRLLHDPDPAVHQAAAREWCAWEAATLGAGGAQRFEDPAFRLAFARIVTHYVRHDAWLEDDELLRGAGALRDISGVMVAGRDDLQAPPANARALGEVWPSAELVVVDGAHAPTEGPMAAALVAATDRFAG
jgi:proline iminopeptidase